MIRRFDLEKHLEQMKPDDVLLIPHQRNYPQISVHCYGDRRFRYWRITLGNREIPGYFTDGETLTDYLYRLRPSEKCISVLLWWRPSTYARSQRKNRMFVRSIIEHRRGETIGPSLPSPRIGGKAR